MANTLGLKPKFEVFTVAQDALEQEFRNIVKRETGVDVGGALCIDMFEDNAFDVCVRFYDWMEHLTDEDIDKVSAVYNWDDCYMFANELLEDIFKSESKPYLRQMYKDSETGERMVAVQCEVI